MSTDRRTFITRLSLLTGGLAAAGGAAWCVWRPGDQAEDTGALPFAVWRDIREALRTSPDHLVARADDLVATGDAAALFAFVRDSIATYPSTPTTIRADRGVSWGLRGTLRGGAGTPREKAELLADLYRRAGWDADVLLGTVPMSLDAARDVICRPPARPFAPRIDATRLTRWRNRLQLPDAPDDGLTVVDPEGRDSVALANAIASQLPDLGRLPSFDWRFGNMPIVRATKAGETIHANLFAPDAPFGEAGIDPARLRPAPAPDPLPDVHISLAMALTSAPDERVPLVDGRWPLEDLIGRQVLARMVPVLNLPMLATARFQDVRIFVPSLTVQSLDRPPGETDERSVLGGAITRDGVRVTSTPDGGVALDDREVIPATPAASVVDVSSLAIAVNASHFPRIRVDVSAHDASGVPVEGLDARAFTVQDDDEAAPFFLRSSQAAPRIALLVDQSGSMPSVYRGEAMTELTARVSTRVRDVYPHAEIRLIRTNSRLWTWLGRAAATDANLIVFATDGHRDDELTSSIRAALGAGPPAVVINVKNYAPENYWYRHSLGPIADATGGTVVPVAREDDIHTALLAYLASSLQELPAYTLDYDVPAPNPGEHRVTVRTSDGRLLAEGRYTAPDDPALPRDTCGLYLTIAVGNDSITRTLAGYDPARHAPHPASREMVTETVGAFFGQQIVSFEAAAPTLSAWLDDFLTAKLAVEPLHHASTRGDRAGIEAALEVGLPAFPPDLLLQTTPLAPPADGRALTFDVGPRIMLAHAHPVLGTDRYAHGIDILPFTRFATAADDPHEAFSRTLTATARLAVAESAVFETSTRSLLRNTPLVTLQELLSRREAPADQLRPFRLLAAAMPRRNHQLVPADGTPPAFWNVDAQTGSLIGVLADGSGGGRQAERIREFLHEYDRVMSQYNHLLLVGAGPALTPIGGFALGVVAIYGQSLVRISGAASLGVTLMDASGIEDAVALEIQRLSCEVMKTTFTSVFGPLGEGFSTLELLIGAFGGDSPFGC